MSYTIVLKGGVEYTYTPAEFMLIVKRTARFSLQRLNGELILVTGLYLWRDGKYRHTAEVK